VLVAWEEPEEPWLQLALWRDGSIRSWSEAPETFDPVVAQPLAGVPFLSRDVSAPVPVVLYRGPKEARGWRGAPIHPALRSRFAIGAVLCLPLRGECLEGHLFALDKPRMTGDDLLLGEVVAHQVASSMDQSLLSRRLRQAAAAEERNRLSRDLHDGVLQSLTGAALQLETVHRLWDSAPRDARDRLAAIQRHRRRAARPAVLHPRLEAGSRRPGGRCGGLDAGLRDWCTGSPASGACRWSCSWGAWTARSLRLSRMTSVSSSRKHSSTPRDTPPRQRARGRQRGERPVQSS
jgi:hypothetical protein